MIAGLCESPLTFQAVMIWRDELNEGKVFLRDIIDLEATYAGPDAKMRDAGRSARTASRFRASVAPRPRRAAAMCRRRRWRRRRRPLPRPRSRTATAPGEGEGRRPTPPPIRHGRGRDGEFHVARRDRSRAQAESARDLRHHRRPLQEAAPAAGAGHRSKLQSATTLSPAQERHFKKLKEDIIDQVKSLQLNTAASKRWSSSFTASTSSWSAMKAG